MPPSVIAFVTDLIFATKISSTAASLGVDTAMARNLDALATKIESGAALALIDMDAEADPLRAIELCRAAAVRPRIVAFVSHVRADLVQAARDAGADLVLARSAFVTRLPALLAEASAVGDNAADRSQSGGST